MPGECQLRIEAPDELAATMIALDLERRGLHAVPDGSHTLTTSVSDRASADEIVRAVQALSQDSTVTLDGAAATSAGVETHAPPGRFAVVIGPPTDRRDKWDSTIKRVEIQIGRDSGRAIERGGSSFAVRNYESTEQADAAAAAIASGLRTKRNLDASVLVVPDASAPLLVNFEADRRELVRQLGYAVEHTYLVQIQVGDPAARSELRSRIEASGVRVAESQRRLLLGFGSEAEAQRVLNACGLPPGAVLQVTGGTLDLAVLRKKLDDLRTRHPAGDGGWVNDWNLAGFGGLTL